MYIHNILSNNVFRSNDSDTIRLLNDTHKANNSGYGYGKNINKGTASPCSTEAPTTAKQSKFRQSLVQCVLHLAKQQIRRFGEILSFPIRSHENATIGSHFHVNLMKCYHRRKNLNEALFQKDVCPLISNSLNNEFEILNYKNLQTRKCGSLSGYVNSKKSYISFKNSRKRTKLLSFASSVSDQSSNIYCTKNNRFDNFQINSQSVFGLAVSQNLWNEFDFFLNAGLQINQPQKLILCTDVQQISFKSHTFASLLDLFLHVIQPPDHYNLDAFRDNLKNESSTNQIQDRRILPKLLSSILRKGARVDIVSAIDSTGDTGGITHETLSKVCEGASNQLAVLLWSQNSNIFDHFDNAGIIRQLLNAGLEPPKDLFSKQHISDKRKSNICNLTKVSSNLYFVILWGLSYWSLNKSDPNRQFSPVLQSFIVLLLNLIHTGATTLPDEDADLWKESVSKMKQILPVTNNSNELEFNMQKYHTAFQHIIAKQPESLFILTRRVVRKQIGTINFQERLNGSQWEQEEGDLSNKQFNRHVSQLPDQVRMAVAYLEGIRLKSELDYLRTV